MPSLKFVIIFNEVLYIILTHFHCTIILKGIWSMHTVRTIPQLLFYDITVECFCFSLSNEKYNQPWLSSNKSTLVFIGWIGWNCHNCFWSSYFHMLYLRSYLCFCGFRPRYPEFHLILILSCSRICRCV